MLRAAGTHGDPNKLGAIAGLWAIGAVVLARRFSPPWRSVASIASIAIGIGAVWTSGSRTGLAAIGVSLAISAFETIRAEQFDLKRLPSSAPARRRLPWWSPRPAERIYAHRGAARHPRLPPLRGQSRYRQQRQRAVVGTVWLWRGSNRDGEGTSGRRRRRLFFHTLVRDFGRGYHLSADNAQAWLRHLVAEFGILGAIPALWWCVVFAMLLFARPGALADRLSVGLLRSVSIGFFVASIFGVPAQNMVVVA